VIVLVDTNSDGFAHRAISLESGSLSGSDEDLGISRGNDGVYGVTPAWRKFGVMGEKKSSEVAFNEFSSATNQVWQRSEDVKTVSQKMA
jgi:hypothetical protein